MPRRKREPIVGEIKVGDLIEKTRGPMPPDRVLEIDASDPQNIRCRLQQVQRYRDLDGTWREKPSRAERHWVPLKKILETYERFPGWEKRIPQLGRYDR